MTEKSFLKFLQLKDKLRALNTEMGELKVDLMKENDKTLPLWPTVDQEKESILKEIGEIVTLHDLKKLHAHYVQGHD